MVVIGMMLYVMLQFAIGVWVSRRIKNETDYILAGRSLGPLLVTFSVFATWFGAEAIVATSSEVYEKGLAGGLVDPLSYAAALMISGAVIAGVLWRRGLTTFADLFRERYSPTVEKLVVLILLPGSVFWAAAQIRAFGQILSQGSGASLILTIVAAGLLVAAYSAVGGLLADAVTDFLQGSVVIIGLVVLLVAVMSKAGGIVDVIEATPAEKLNVLAGFSDGPLAQMEAIVVAICGSLVAVELISRFLGARSAAVAVSGTIAGGFVYLVVGLIPVLLGLAAAHLADGDDQLREELAHSEQVIASLAQYYLPQWNYVVFGGAIVSAILSSVHSSLHAPASQVSHNIVLAMRPDLSAAGRLLAVRLTVLALSVVAVALALTSERIKDLVEFASAFGSAGVFVCAIFAIFTRVGGPDSAIASVLAGTLVWAIGRFAIDATAPYITALVVSGVVYLAVAAWQDKLRPAVA
jgi:SSS family transporter